MDEMAIQAIPGKVDDKTAIQTAPVPSELAPARPLTLADLLLRGLHLLASLRLTVILLSLCTILVFLGTLAQIDHGLYQVLRDYFRCKTISWIPLQLFVRFGQIFLNISPNLQLPNSVGFPFPGGWLLGGLLLANVLAAHLVRFKLTWKRSGILILHAGLIVMMIGELLTGVYAVEGRMTIVENGSSNFTESHDTVELAVIDRSDPKVDRVVAIPRSMLREGEVIADESLPFDIEVIKFLPNSSEPRPPAAGQANPATAGHGARLVVAPLPPASGTEADKIDVSSTYVTLKERATGKVLGTWLLSLWFAIQDEPEVINVGGIEYHLFLRFQRNYKPYTIYLKDFRHDLYPGTTIPKNFSSLVRLVDPERGEDREVKIWMNNPLRYQGETFYQSSFLPGDRGTILQVVNNPGILLPYISCVMVAAGMLIHFIYGLVGFLSLKKLKVQQAAASRPAAVKSGFGEVFPLVATGGAALVMLIFFMLALQTGSSSDSELDLAGVGRLPCQEGGRVKPLDSLARDTMKIISGGRESYYDSKDQRQPAVRWLLDVLSGNREAEKVKIFRIDNEEVVSLLGLEPRPGWRYAISEFANKIDALERERQRASQIDPKTRTAYDAKVLELAEHLELYITTYHCGWAGLLALRDAGKQLQDILQEPDNKGKMALAMYRARMEEMQARMKKVRLVPPPSFASEVGDDWQSLPLALQEMLQTERDNKPAQQFAAILIAYGQQKPADFNKAVSEYRSTVDRQPAVDADRILIEHAFFNQFKPFHWCMFLYITIFLLVCGSWLGWQAPLSRAAFWLAVLTFGLHTAALIGRMYLMDRWWVFVTNLYSSAVFIGWVGMAIALILERIFPLGIATATASLLGFATAFLADYLAQSGDTLGMLQAVLDTNFWLATHVTTITFGYGATFIAGFIGIAYIITAIGPHFLRWFSGVARNYGYGKTSDWAGGVGQNLASNPDLLKALNLMIYGVVCFATLLSFVGTVLGGIWADQSWGRFWGWDPKENGALMIVLWNALILHARWAGMVKQMGTAVLAVAGNMVVAWSWFGTNQLGVGLHAYGFNNTLAIGLTVFWITHLLIIGGVGVSLWYLKRMRPEPAAAP